MPELFTFETFDLLAYWWRAGIQRSLPIIYTLGFENTRCTGRIDTQADIFSGFLQEFELQIKIFNEPLVYCESAHSLLLAQFTSLSEDFHIFHKVHEPLRPSTARPSTTSQKSSTTPSRFQIDLIFTLRAAE